DAEFVRFDPEKSREAPKHEHAEHDESEAAAAQITAGQHTSQSVLTTPKNFFEIWRCRSRRLRPRAPWPLAARASGAPVVGRVIGDRRRRYNAPSCRALTLIQRRIYVANEKSASSSGPAKCSSRDASCHISSSIGGKAASPSGEVCTCVISSRSAIGMVMEKMSLPPITIISSTPRFAASARAK